MFGKRNDSYEFSIEELNQQQLLQQILLTLERMEVLLQSIDSKLTSYPVRVEQAAKVIANSIDRNTEKLSAIELFPDPQPKSMLKK